MTALDLGLCLENVASGPWPLSLGVQGCFHRAPRIRSPALVRVALEEEQVHTRFRTRVEMVVTGIRNYTQVGVARVIVCTTMAMNRRLSVDDQK